MVFEDSKIVQNINPPFWSSPTLGSICLTNLTQHYRRILQQMFKYSQLLTHLPFNSKESLALYCNTLSSKDILCAKFDWIDPVALDTK